MFQSMQNLQCSWQEILIITYLNGVIRICNKCNEKAENHVYEKADEGI